MGEKCAVCGYPDARKKAWSPEMRKYIYVCEYCEAYKMLYGYFPWGRKWDEEELGVLA